MPDASAVEFLGNCQASQLRTGQDFVSRIGRRYGPMEALEATWRRRLRCPPFEMRHVTLSAPGVNPNECLVFQRHQERASLCAKASRRHNGLTLRRNHVSAEMSATDSATQTPASRRAHTRPRHRRDRVPAVLPLRPLYAFGRYSSGLLDGQGRTMAGLQSSGFSRDAGTGSSAIGYRGSRWPFRHDARSPPALHVTPSAYISEF